MITRFLPLDHDIKFYDAVQRGFRVEVIHDGETIGFGKIIDFTGEFVAIIDAETGEKQDFIRANFQFYVEKPVR